MPEPAPELWPVPEGNLWGYVDRMGEAVIPSDRFMFTGAEPFSEGLAAVIVKKKRGYIDAKGELAIEPQFDSATRFSEGLAWVAKGRRKEPCFYIDRSGERAFSDSFMQAGTFVEGRAVVARQPKGGGACHQTWLDRHGDPVLPWLPRQIWPLTEGLARATDPESGLWGYLDREGDWVITPRYRHAGAFSGGLAVVVEEVGDNEGDLVTRVIDQDAGEVWRLAVPYLDTRCYQEGLLLVPVDPDDTFAKAFVDRNGEVVIPPSRRHVGTFSDGRARIQTPEGRVGFIDRAGRVVVAPVLRFATDYERGLARVGPFVERPGTHGLIDMDGRWVWPKDAAERGYPLLSP